MESFRVRAGAGLSLFLLVGMLPGCVATGASEGPASTERLRSDINVLKPLHTRMGEPRPGEWLYVHGDEEKGQTFAQYQRSHPIRPTASRRTICLQPLGPLTAGQRKVMDAVAEFMRIYFDLPVRVEKELPLSVIPPKARRVHPEWRTRQILSTYVLDHVLRPRLPKDAAVFMCITASDLWPGDDWNFVFGQASLRWRVAVESLHRIGDPDAGEAEYRQALLRTLKTATHETGHMFGMRHCIVYNCNMNGSNSREESDSRPLWLCPECFAKVCWCMKTDPAARCGKLETWCRAHGFEDEAAYFASARKALDGQPISNQDKR